MPHKIIKGREVVEDSWQVVEKDATTIPDGQVIIPAELWLSQREALTGRSQIGVWLDCDQSPKLIAEDLAQFDIVACNFPAFTDGRGFTYGRELREQHGYQGEVRAIGDFMRDQLFYLQRCGFDAFAIENTDIDDAVNSLSDFSDSYQAAIDQPQPRFRRR
jgi:uncharacterized protein (DUF934 family)